MLCRQCGTEIAEKAIVCYRCGTATSEPKFKPAAEPRRSSSSFLASLIALALLVALALYMGRLPAGGMPRSASWAAVAAALVILLLRAVARWRSNR